VTPRLARVLVILAAGLAVLVAALTDDEPVRAAGEELALPYLYTEDAKKMLEPLIERFNRESHRSGGREIRIAGKVLNSGEAEAALEARQESPVLWTPASSLWGRLLDHRAGAAWVPDANPSLAFSPQVIAMWEPMARALGWPDPKVGWKDVLALATSGRGWAAYGHPEFGPFRLGHTNPDISTSGLHAVASEYYAMTRKRRGLTLADVRRPDVRAAVRAIERSIVHYGPTATAFTDQMDEHGPPYAHAVYTQELSVREFNAKRRQGTKLVPISPADGTFVADYPLIVLSAPWVGAGERAAAAVFRDWLVPRITAEDVARSGLRLRRPQGLTELELPEPEVLAAIRDAWHEDRKPANIVLVVDTSATMAGAGKIDAAKQGLLSFLDELSSEDRVALVTSGEAVETKVELGPPAQSGAAVASAVRGLFPDGDAPVYPAITRAFRDVRALGDADRINAVVVLSDGTGTDAGRDALRRAIAAAPVTEGTPVRIFTVAYGKDADTKALKEIADRSGGRFFEGGPRSIEDVYRDISLYF
jgi:Ca-activated chloride channel family protein